VFERFTGSDSKMHVEFGMGTKHEIKGFGTISFWMESGGTLRGQDVLWMPELKRSVISVSMNENKGFGVVLQNGKALIMPRASSSNKVVVFRVRESYLYRLKSQPMREISRSIVTENREQVDPKVEQLRGSHPLGSGGKDKPSKSVKDSWYNMAM
jgi:hypothetical protein